MEIKKIGDILSKQSNIENSYVMVPHHHYAYYIDAKIVEGNFSEGIPDDTFENYVTRKNWTGTEIFNSNLCLILNPEKYIMYQTTYHLHQRK